MSIRFKMTAWFSFLLILIVAAVYVSLFVTASSVLTRTQREYLVAGVEANADAVSFYGPDDVIPDPEGKLFIEYEGGYLAINNAFLDVINNVYGALYTEEGALVYGINPLAREMEGEPFSGSQIRSITVDGMQYDIYDRKLQVDGVEGLWLRGVVSQSQAIEQLSAITRISLVLLPAFLALSLWGGYLLAGRLLKPVRRIEETAAEISGGTDLKRRIALKGPEDELHKLADTFDGMLERLDDSFEIERRFTSDASHELRTPMSVILAQCEYILSKDRTSEQYVDALRTIRRQGARMNGLINDMLDYTRMEQKAENYPLTAIDYSALVREVSTEMAMLKTNGITLYARIVDGIFISGNRMLLTRMLQNLIGNAYRYGKENGSTEVRLFSDAQGDMVLEVADNGIGIEAEQIPRLFDRFYRAESSRTTMGTGLGLSMVKRIAEIHGAVIDVTSAPGEGTTFTIRFPRMTAGGQSAAPAAG